MNILWGIAGILTILFLSLLLSVDRKHIKGRTVLGALAIQVLFAFITLKLPAGRAALFWFSEALSGVVGYANEGISFLFGPLVGDGAVFAFEVLTIIIFFSSLISILYYYGIMQWVIDILGGALSKLLRTTKVESLSAAANIFLGQTEAPLVVKPYLSSVSESELFAIMVGGFGSVSGTVLVGYSLLGIPLEYLLAASFMSAPSALLLSKIVYPLSTETLNALEENQDKVKIKENPEEKAVNVIDAAASGASTGLNMALQIGAILLAFVSLIALLNGILSGIGGWFGIPNLTMEHILGILLSPVAFLIGVPWNEAVTAAQYIGQKVIVNEFVAYSGVGQIADTLSDKTLMILSFGLAGFANIGAIASQIGGLGSLAPNRRKDISRLGLRGMVTGALVSLLNAAIAGMFL